MPVNEGVSVRRTKDERPEKYSYSSLENVDGQIMWTLINMQRERIFSVGDLHRARRRNDTEMNRKENNMLFIGTCDSYVPCTLVAANPALSNEAKGAIRCLGMALKSRPMRSLRNFQKRKYGTAPTILGVQGSRGASSLQVSSFEYLQKNVLCNENVENAALPASDNLDDVAGDDDKEDILFHENDIVVFRGTEGLAFELLEITSNIFLAEVSDREKIVGNFSAETENIDNTVTYYRDPNWMSGSMMFKNIIRNKDNGIVFVAMQRFSTPKSTFF